MKYMIFTAFGLMVLSGIVIFLLIKNKKIIYSGDEGAEAKEMDENVLKILKLKGYRVSGSKRTAYSLIYNNRPAEVRLEKTVFLRKNWSKYILFVNNEEKKFVDNKDLRKKILEYNYASNIRGVVIINTLDKSLDTLSFANKKEKLLNSWLFTMLIFITILLTINIFFLLNFIYGS